jgi:DnaJ-class molecular chaperone
MYVKINIEVPVKLSAEEKDLLQKLDKIMQNKVSSNPKSESFFKKVGDFFK